MRAGLAALALLVVPTSAACTHPAPRQASPAEGTAVARPDPVEQLPTAPPPYRGLMRHHQQFPLEGTVVVATRTRVATLRRVLVGPRATPAGEYAIDSAPYRGEVAWAFRQVGGAAVAYEPYGFTVIGKSALVRLSASGRTVAVASSNEEAMIFFGYARDGRLRYGPEEFAYDRKRHYPAEVRDLAALAWIDLDAPWGALDDAWPAEEVAPALVEHVTGVRAPDDWEYSADWFLGPLAVGD